MGGTGAVGVTGDGVAVVPPVVEEDAGRGVAVVAPAAGVTTGDGVAPAAGVVEEVALGRENHQKARIPAATTTGSSGGG